MSLLTKLLLIPTPKDFSPEDKGKFRIFLVILKFPIIFLKWILLLPIFFYQRFLSPILPASCRFSPTCSSFMVESIKKNGPIWGLLLGIYRIIRCNPFHPGGYDPVDRWPPYWDGKRYFWKLPEKNRNNSDNEVFNEIDNCDSEENNQL